MDMADHEWPVEGELADERSRIGWFAAGALTAIALIGIIVFAATVFEWPSDEEVVADTPPVVIEGY
jgi:hypothetical protein